MLEVRQQRYAYFYFPSSIELSTINYKDQKHLILKS